MDARESKDESVSFEDMEVEDWIKRSRPTDSLLMRGLLSAPSHPFSIDV